MDAPTTDLGKRLDEVARRLGGRAHLARACGLSPASITNYIVHGRQPRAELICRICRVADLSADWLLGLQTAESHGIVKESETVFGQLTDPEREMVQLWRRLPEPIRRAQLEIYRYWLAQIARG